VKLDVQVLYPLLVIIALLTVDVLLQAAYELKNGNFSFQVFPRTIATNVGPYVLGLLAIATPGLLSGSTLLDVFGGKVALASVFNTIFDGFAVAYMPKLVADITAKTSQLVGGAKPTG
jgi:hypothetical protein